MEKKKIVFDVDMTLIDWNDLEDGIDWEDSDNRETGVSPKPREEVINLMRAFNSLGWAIYVHSGGGVQYAENWVRKLGLDKEMHITVTPKGSPDYEFDIAVDDAIDARVATEQGRSYIIKADYFIKV